MDYLLQKEFPINTLIRLNRPISGNCGEPDDLYPSDLPGIPRHARFRVLPGPRHPPFRLHDHHRYVRGDGLNRDRAERCLARQPYHVGGDRG